MKYDGTWCPGSSLPLSLFCADLIKPGGNAGPIMGLKYKMYLYHFLVTLKSSFQNKIHKNDKKSENKKCGREFYLTYYFYL